MMRETSVAIKAARAAGKIAMRYFGKKINVETKTDGTPVTAADKLCEKKIISIIKKYFPEHGIVGEESGEMKGNESRWFVDPIDGTKDFIRAAPFFATLIGLEKKGRLLAGVISLPALNKIIYAEKGRGAYSDGKRLRVSGTNAIKESYVLHGSLKGFYKMKLAAILERLAAAGTIRSFSSSYGFSLVAAGVADANIEPVVMPWDLAATKIVIEEAGGRMTDLNGKDTIYGGNAIASNGKLHNELLGLMKK